MAAGHRVMDTLRAGEPVALGEVTLVPIEHLRLQSHAGEGRSWLSARKEAHAVVVCGAGGARAFTAEGSEIPVASLTRKIPDLGELLASLSR